MQTIRHLFRHLLSRGADAGPRPPRSFRALDSWSLDFKLGLRMLIKHPGLTLVGGFGIAAAVAISAGTFSVIFGNFLSPSLPLEESDRLVSLEVWDSAASQPERHILHDYHVWRESLQSLREISAFRTLTPNLIVPGAPPATVRVASMTASGFTAARVRPLIGRHLVNDDERQGAPSVVVIGENLWRSRFGRDPAILGKTLQLGATPHTIVGVMPEGFAFPVNHQLWVPLRLGTATPEPRTGPDLMVFGRLAPRATLESAQAELAAIGSRIARTAPKLYARLQPRVLPYAHPFLGMHGNTDVSELHAMQGVVSVLLVVVCLNVAILVYSRTAMRHAEIAIRTALGANRRRIVAQLFVEALVLSLVAAVAGIAIAEFALRQMAAATLPFASELPFWLTFHLSPGAVLYAVVLSVLSAAIVGIVPALKATSRQVQTGLRIIGAGGSGMRLGTTWTALIVAQVGFAVALLPGAAFNAWETMQAGLADPGFPADEFLTVQLGMDTPGTDRSAAASQVPLRYARGQAELVRRLEAEPRVSGVTFAMVNPGEEAGARIETESLPSSGSPAGGTVVSSGTSGHEVRFNRVDLNFFRTFGVPILAGRGFEPADLGTADAREERSSVVLPDSSAIVVNQSFSERIFGGNALGRRVRYLGGSRGSAAQDVETGRWYEIVGIVRDFPTGASPGMDDSPLKLYHPLAAGQLQPVTMALRIRGGSSATFGPRLREIGAAADPELHLRNLFGLDEALRREQWIRRTEASVLGGLTLSVLMLSSAGIYALMSIIVSQRRKEIGIRTALGADRKRIVASIFSRALGQLAIGAALGMASAALLENAPGGGLLQGNGAILLPLVALFMMVVGCLAAIGPARRSLRIEPTEALRDQ